MSGLAAISEPATSPWEMKRMRAPAARHALDHLVVARPVEHHDHQVADGAALGRRDLVERLLDRRADVDLLVDVGAAGQLLHVEHGAGVEHRALLGGGDHGERVGLAAGDERGALERVDGHVELGAGARADVLAVVQHGRLVLLALADHDHALHVDRREHDRASRRPRPDRRRSSRRSRPSGRRRSRPPRSRARVRARGSGQGSSSRERPYPPATTRERGRSPRRGRRSCRSRSIRCTARAPRASSRGSAGSSR